MPAPHNIFGRIRGWLGGRHSEPPPPPTPEEQEEEEGMLRMSFLEHLQELRSRIIKSLVGIAVAGVLSLSFSSALWRFVQQPAAAALKSLGVDPPELVALEPMEPINIIWFKLPILCAIFIASPWVLYQVWAFISPGLYKRERRWASPFIVGSAGLFIAGGVFAYFVLFRFALTFLLGLGMANNVRLAVSMSRYFDLFVNVILGVGLVFELPILIFMLTLLRIVNPGFLLRHSRYAILVIFILAAVITPTPDAFNLMLFAIPMCLLFFIGIFGSYLIVIKREGRRFPWRWLITIVICVLLVLGLVLYILTTRYQYHLVPQWPFLMR